MTRLLKIAAASAAVLALAAGGEGEHLSLIHI